MRSYLLLSAVLFLVAGCSFRRSAVVERQNVASASDAKVTEQSRTLTTAIVDTLAVAPSNAPTVLAQRFAKADQQLEGIPQHRIDVIAALAGQQAATNDVEARLADVERLTAENQAAKTALAEAKGKLEDMGRLYEAEHNKGIVKRVWHWLTATIGIGGIIALCIFCPAVIPIFARILAWIVAKVPALASTIGVVSTKAFDSVVKGVEQFKQHASKESAPAAVDALHDELSKSMDQDAKDLVRARKPSVTT